MEQTGPVTFKVWVHLRNKVKRTQANELKRATIEEWDIPEKIKPIRQATRTDSRSDQKGNDSETEIETVFRETQQKATNNKEQRRSANEESDEWDEEDEIPLIKLKRRL